jgi:hypothetical protein
MTRAGSIRARFHVCRGDCEIAAAESRACAHIEQIPSSSGSIHRRWTISQKKTGLTTIATHKPVPTQAGDGRGSGRRGAPVMSGGSAATPRAGGEMSVTRRPGSSARCAGHVTRSPEAGRCRPARDRRPNSLDHAHRRGRVIRGDALASIFEPEKIAQRIFQATKCHRGCNSRLYCSSACLSDRASPESSFASPAVISPICYSLSSTYAAIASAARNDLERLVLRASTTAGV